MASLVSFGVLSDETKLLLLEQDGGSSMGSFLSDP